jgi:outer membrane protein OmpA-like peptidoglycan-associated protein
MNRLSCLLCAVLLTFALPLHAEPDRPGGKDYPLISRFPQTHISFYEERDFDWAEFAQAQGPALRVEGRKFRIDYALDKGSDKASKLEISRNYQNALSAAGWSIVESSDSGVTASLKKDGKEVWATIEAGSSGAPTFFIVEKGMLPMVIEANKATARAAGAPADKEGKDYPGIPRLPNQRRADYKEVRFDFFDFSMASGPSHRVEGRKIVVRYEMDPGARALSALQFRGNYQKVLTDEGWVPVGVKDSWVTAVFRNNDKETWAQVEYSASGGGTTVTVIEKGDMKQVVTASALLERLNREGHVSFEVHFDTGKDEIKAESKAIVAQMVDLLKSSPALKVEVQGHTDNQGNEKDNQSLSERRAKAVMAALVSGGIEDARLSAKGYGQSKPIADNGTEGGRALNRRVELSKR